MTRKLPCEGFTKMSDEWNRSISKKEKNLISAFAICILTLIFVTSFISSESYWKNHGKLQPVQIPNFLNSENNQSFPKSPWENVPQFQLHLRMVSWSRLVDEYKRWFLISYKHFFPPDRARDALVLVFDKESPEDRKAATSLQNRWPYPRVCYRPPVKNPDMYKRKSKFRMYYEQFFPEYCITEEYVGYVDSDTVWSSVVTPGSLFDNGRPIVNARIGPIARPCWAQATHYLLGFKEVMQCMAYFPIMIKVQHVIELREFITRRLNITFEQAFANSMDIGDECLCQYSVMCNYVWKFHRSEYKFHMQMRANGNWDGKKDLTPHSVGLDFYNKIIPPSDKIPKPRVSLHIRHLLTMRKVRHFNIDLHVPPVSDAIGKIMSESLCYNGGFEKCPQACKQFNKDVPFYYIYNFEWDDWLWDGRCKAEQDKYFQEAKSLLEYYAKTNQPVLGLAKSDDLCWYIV